MRISYSYLYAGYIISVRRMVMDHIVLGNRPVDPGSSQGGHRPLSFVRNKYIERANGLP